MSYNYESMTEQDNGYDHRVTNFYGKDYTYKDFFKTFNKEFYDKLDENGKQMLIDKVFDMYREVNIFPITYYNSDGINSEIDKCINKKIEWNLEGINENVLDFKYNQGSSLCKFLFPNLHKVQCKGAKSNSMWDRFYDDHKLKRAIKLCYDIKTGANPSSLRSSLELIGGNVATNFKAMNAKALYERYCAPGGVIYDFACGFGGRMLGALTSDNGYTYIGVEPCSETFDSLNVLGNTICNHMGKDSKKTFTVVKMGSEKFKPTKGEFVDFAFSSPPYFTLERYSDEETQCYIEYPTLDEWFDGYVKPTIENIYHVLKSDAYYAVNIADFKVSKDEVKFVDKWVELSIECGFEYIETIHMKLSARKGYGHGNDKKEGIFVFKKSKKESMQNVEKQR